MHAFLSRVREVVGDTSDVKVGKATRAAGPDNEQISLAGSSQ